MIKLSDLLDQDQMQKLKVLRPGETRKDVNWRLAVEQAKILYKYSQELRLKIAQLAQDVCDLSHGGRARHSKYTVKRFAEDVGMPHRTLLEWVRIKRDVIDKLPEEKRHESITFYKTLSLGVGADSSEATILKKYNKLANKDDATVRMEKYLAHLKTILYNSERWPLLKGCDESVLSEVAHVASEVAFNLDKYLNRKKVKLVKGGREVRPLKAIGE